VFRYRSKAGVRSKVTIARYPDLSLRAAREERDKLAAQVARGVSPAHEQKEQKREQKEREQGRGSDPTLAQFTERWYRELVLPPKGRNHRRNPKPARGALDNQILPALLPKSQLFRQFGSTFLDSRLHGHLNRFPSAELSILIYPRVPLPALVPR
jgi:hypothetical protein